MRVWQGEVRTALESFFRVGTPGVGKTNDRFDALLQVCTGHLSSGLTPKSDLSTVFVRGLTSNHVF